MLRLTYSTMKTPPSDTPYALVVDDDFIIRMDATDILEQAGFQVLDASHGDEAFVFAQVTPP